MSVEFYDMIELPTQYGGWVQKKAIVAVMPRMEYDTENRPSRAGVALVLIKDGASITLNCPISSSNPGETIEEALERHVSDIMTKLAHR